MTTTDPEARAFLAAHEKKIRPLFRASNLAAWEAATTGSEDALRRSADARTAVKRIYADGKEFELVRSFLAKNKVGDPLLRRQLVVLDHAYTANQLPPDTIADLTRRECDLERIFYNFRASYGGKELSNNQLREVLEKETDSRRRQRAWEASKSIGPLIADPLLELVRRRNAAARDLGFEDYYSMELQLQEIEEGELFGLLEDFHTRSEAVFRDVRGQLDERLAERFAIEPADVRPWHWDDFFGQEAPSSNELDLDPLFESLDFEQFAREYFASVGLPVEDVLERSDLYEREGKDQHAFCTDIDREGDVRTLCNLRPNERWMRTLLHELGHAVYDKFIPRDLPFLLRSPAHTLATESIAMYFGRRTRDPAWLQQTVGRELTAEQEQEVHAQQRLSMLVAARWMLVMVHFERALYADPDRANLNKLWWDLVERYQLIQRPDDRDQPDWATKLHLSLAPVYYHNYLLGELMASQLTHALTANGESTPGIGEFLRQRIFARGATLPWNDLVREATGEALSGRYFVDQFVGGA
ncbi:MAG: M2 family metallopeptidase [Gemmatimonadota bacterium]